MASDDGLTEEEKRARWEEHCADERRDEEAASVYEESVDAILYEMHERSVISDLVNNGKDEYEIAEMFANRIEAALKRERAKKEVAK